MSILRRFREMVRPARPTYAIVPSPSETTDVCIEHVSGVTIRIEHDGRVIVSAPSSMAFHAEGDLQITSNTHIGLVAPRIDLN